MKRLFMGLLIASSLFTTGFVLISSGQKAAAFVCADDTVHPNPPTNLSGEDRQAIYDDTCAGRGGLKSINNEGTVPTGQGCDAPRFFLGWYY